MTAEQVAERYSKKGYQHVHVRRDEPNFTYHTHYHGHPVTLHVVEGELTVVRNHRRHLVQPDQYIEIPAEELHTTAIGPAGCVYIHAEEAHHPRT